MSQRPIVLQSLFALNRIFRARRSDDPGDELTGNFGSELENTSIGERPLFRLFSRKFVARHFGIFETLSANSSHLGNKSRSFDA